MRNALVRARFSTRPIRLLARNMVYWVRVSARFWARKVQRRFQTKPLVTASEKEIVALAHHGWRGSTSFRRTQSVPLSTTVLVAPTRENLTSWRTPRRWRSAGLCVPRRPGDDRGEDTDRGS